MKQTASSKQPYLWYTYYHHTKQDLKVVILVSESLILGRGLVLQQRLDRLHKRAEPASLTMQSTRDIRAQVLQTGWYLLTMLLDGVVKWMLWLVMDAHDSVCSML